MSNKARVYLYKEGNECPTITGGWSSLHSQKGYGTVTFSKLTNSLKISMLNGSSAKGDICQYRMTNSVSLNNAILYGDVTLDNISNKAGQVQIYIKDSSHDKTLAYVNASSKTYAVTGIVDEGDYLLQINTTGVSEKCIPGVVLSGVQNSSELYINNIYADFTSDVITINSQDKSNLSCTFNNFDNLLSFTQIDILSNNQVIQSYTENLSEIIYDFDSSLMDYGNNEISIQATYTQGDGIYGIAELVSDTLYVREVELELEEFEPIIDLPSTSTLKEVVQRFSVIESTNKAIGNNLKNLLESKGFIVGDTPRLSNMVKLVNELSNNNSAEITEYINRINELESEVDDNKRNLYNVLVNKGVTDIATADTFEQLIDLVSTRLALIETKSVLMDTTYINSNGKFLNHTKTIITGYNNTAGFSIVGTQPNYVGTNYMSGRLRCDFVIDFTYISSVSFFAKKVTQHGIVSVWISDGLPDNVIEKDFTSYYACVCTGYDVTDWTAYSMDTDNITGIKTLSFIGGYVDRSGSSASRTDYSSIILNYSL